MAQSGRAAWGFGVVSVVCILAALIPVFRGGSANAVFMACAGMFLIVAIGARARSAPKGPKPPSAA